MSSYDLLDSGFGADQQVRAREYLRVSLDRSGRERSQDDQHKDNQRVVDRYGWNLGDAYRETGSASRYAQKSRKDFDRLMTDLPAGRFEADVLIIWEASRGSRKVGEWVSLLDLCEAQGIRIYVTTHGRLYDPRNGRDRRTLLEDAVDSEYEASKTSDRVRRTTETEAAEGKPHGPVPLGYKREYDPRTGKLLRQIEDTESSMIIRFLFGELKAGNSLVAIARLFTERGWTNGMGRPFHPQQLRNIALNATYAGIRVHRPRRPDGSRDGLAHMPLMPGTRQSKGQWEPLVDPADFWAVQRILTDPRRKTSRSGAARHLLSRIARCGECGSGLVGAQARGYKEPIYRCPTGGHVSLGKSALDNLAEAAVWAYLSDPAQYAATMSREQHQAGTELHQLRTDLEHVRAELSELRALLGAGKLSVATAAATEPLMLERISTMEARELELTTPSELRSLIAPGEDVHQRWASMPISAKRQVMRILLSADHLGELAVKRRPGGRSGPKVPLEERVVWRRDVNEPAA